jgi:hypothetical protein
LLVAPGATVGKAEMYYIRHTPGMGQVRCHANMLMIAAQLLALPVQLFYHGSHTAAAAS